MDPEIVVAVRSVAVNGEVACADAHRVAEHFSMSPEQMGELLDELSLRVTRCQFGLFGYGSKAEGKSKIVLRATNVPPEIEAAIRAKTVNGRIPCLTAWEIADRYKYPRLGIANVIEALGVRVSPCQLGCF